MAEILQTTAILNSFSFCRGLGTKLAFGVGTGLESNSGAPAAEGRQAEPHTHISGAPAAEGRQAEPHTHIRKLKGTHELIFSCVSWLAVLLVGAYARRRRRRRRWWSRATWRPQLTRKPKRGFSFRGLSL